jgi:hypothetical protein
MMSSSVGHRWPNRVTIFVVAFTIPSAQNLQPVIRTTFLMARRVSYHRRQQCRRGAPRRSRRFFLSSGVLTEWRLQCLATTTGAITRCIPGALTVATRFGPICGYEKVAEFGSSSLDRSQENRSPGVHRRGPASSQHPCAFEKARTNDDEMMMAGRKTGGTAPIQSPLTPRERRAPPTQRQVACRGDAGGAR